MFENKRFIAAKRKQTSIVRYCFGKIFNFLISLNLGIGAIFGLRHTYKIAFSKVFFSVTYGMSKKTGLAVSNNGESSSLPRPSCVNPGSASGEGSQEAVAPSGSALVFTAPLTPPSSPARSQSGPSTPKRERECSIGDVVSLCHQCNPPQEVKVAMSVQHGRLFSACPDKVSKILFWFQPGFFWGVIFTFFRSFRVGSFVLTVGLPCLSVTVSQDIYVEMSPSPGNSGLALVPLWRPCRPAGLKKGD